VRASPLLGLAFLLAAAPARADPSSSGASPTELRLYGAAALVGGGASLIAGGIFMVEGLTPCPEGKDCSTRGLGVVFGAPLVVVGAGLLGVGGYFLMKASKVEDERRTAVVLGPNGVGVRF
jgi:hypothetical protein